MPQLPSADAVHGLLLSRRSVREFKDKAVPKGTLATLLDVARRAPTATNSQKLHWIVVQDAAKVRKVAAEIVAWVRATGVFPMVPELWDAGYDFALRGAPAVVLACTPSDYAWGKEDCTIALTFLELAAVSSGLGACWAGFLTHAVAAHPPVREALQVPEGFAVCGALMLGYPKYRYQHVPPRKPLSVQWV